MRASGRLPGRAPRFALILLALAGPATPLLHGDITYVDAVEGAAGNTFATGGAPADTGWLNFSNAASADDDQWMRRSFGNGGALLQAFHDGDQLPEITTRVSGLADGTYEVWVFFWDGPNSNTWTISAGLASGALTTYSHDGPGDTASPLAASTLTFTNAPMVFEDPRILYGVRLGRVSVAAGSPIDVFIDNLVGGGSNTRTWYDGVGYELVIPAGEDTDGDGLPDSYEQTIIDADPGDSVDGLEDVMGTGAAPAVTDFDGDGADDAREYAEGTDPLDEDSDDDGLLDGVESNTGVFVDADDTGTDPLEADTDGDGIPDGIEVDNGSDPTDGDDPPDPVAAAGPRVFGIDFNRNDALGAPSQSLFRIIAGSTTQADNAASYTKTIGGLTVSVSQPDATPLEFRGANGDSSRAIPGGDISRSFLVSDFTATREGAIDVEITGLPAGDYVFRSWHLDTTTGGDLGFAQGATTTTPNTLEAHLGGTLRAVVQPTSLGSPGLGTTFIDDADVPELTFGFTHEGLAPLLIQLRAAEASGDDAFLLLNGFEILQGNP